MTLMPDDNRLLLGISLLRGEASEAPAIQQGQSLVDTIVETVARAIVDGAYPPGMVLSSIMLADRFSTSRTPVREAMLVLEKHGLIEIPPRRQPRVAAISRKEVRDVYAVQAVLLGMVFELCARTADSNDLARLRAAFERMRAAAAEGDDDAYFWANIGFHDVAAEASGNATLKKILDPLRLRTLQLRRVTLVQPGRLSRSLADHERLLEACERGEHELAAVIVRTLNVSALALLERLLDEEEARTPKRARLRRSRPEG